MFCVWRYSLEISIYSLLKGSNEIFDFLDLIAHSFLRRPLATKRIDRDARSVRLPQKGLIASVINDPFYFLTLFIFKISTIYYDHQN